MKISKLIISGYGKLSNFEINLQNGLNIIYGSNEAGKSTVLSFIKAVLYGQRKGKVNGWTEKDRFRPWQGGAYGGTLEYLLENGEKYKVWRDFETGQTKIYDSNLNEITDRFHGSRSQGPLFAQQHTGVDQELFESTCFVSQTALRIGDQLRAASIEKIGGIIETGSERASYGAAKKILDKVLLEEIGTDRTTQKPINKLKGKIEKLKEQKKILCLKLEKIHALESGLKELNEIKSKLDMESAQMQNTVDILERQEKLTQSEKISRQVNNLRNELQQKENELARITAELPKATAIFDHEVGEKLIKIDENIRDSGKRKKLLGFTASALIAVGALFLLIDRRYWVLEAALLAIGIIVWILAGKNQDMGLDGELKDILDAAGVQSIEKYFDKKRELTFIFEKKKIMEEAVALIKNQLAVLNESEAPQNISGQKDGIMLKLDAVRSAGNAEDIKKQLLERMERLNEISLKIKELETEIRILSDETEQISFIEEELDIALNEKEKLEEYRYCICKAIEVMDLCSQKIKSEIVPRMISDTGRIFKALAGDYSDIGIEDETGQVVISSRAGAVVPISHMSGGTIDQFYLALRLSMSSALSANGEPLPIILDEVFTMFDDERFGSAVELLKRTYTDKQVIIITCKEAEAAALAANLLEATLIRL